MITFSLSIECRSREDPVLRFCLYVQEGRKRWRKRARRKSDLAHAITNRFWEQQQPYEALTDYKSHGLRRYLLTEKNIRKVFG